MRPKIFMSDDFKSMIDAQPSADDQRNERARSIHQHVGLARESAQAIDQWLIEIAGGVVMPGIHRNP